MASSSTGDGKPDRLFVGNLSPTVDEYTLVQVFSKYGKITKLDLMMHNSGPQKGKSRGYAFVEYANKDDAVKALVKLHDRLLRGRKLVVTYANAAPPDEGMYPKSRRVGEAAKPTTLSLLKAQRRPLSTEAQIAAMEAKLAAMRQRPDRSPTPERVAADELEAEIQRELEQSGGQVDESGKGRSRDRTETSTAPTSLSPDVKSPVPPRGSMSRTASPLPLSGIASLPPKPAAAAAAASSSRSPPPRRRQDERRGGSKDTFERGLASLPKKPTFL